MNKTFSLSLLFVLIFTGCSTKQYYEPQESNSFEQNSLDLNSTIIDLNNDGITLENQIFVSKKATYGKLNENYKFLNFVENTLIASDNNGSIYTKNNQNETKFQFEKNIISASKQKNLLAFGSVDNSITLFNTKNKTILFKEYLRKSRLNNISIANPVFLDSVVLYPTLDGKVVIVDLIQRAIVKTINIDPQNDIKNIIFLKEIDDALVAASTKKLFTFVNGKANIKDIDIQKIILKDNYIYIATLDGEIIKYNLNLQKIASKKFKFAKIHALAFGSDLYALESQDYLIKISKDFKDVKVYDFSFNEDEKVLSIDDRIYFEDEYIILK